MYNYPLFIQSQTITQDNNLSKLLLNDAFSNYVTFGLGIVVGIIGWLIVNYISRKRPQLIEVINKEQVSLLEIDSQVERDIKLEYKGQPIYSLHRTSIILLNNGEEKIENIALTIYTDDLNLPTKILDWLTAFPSLVRYSSNSE